MGKQECYAIVIILIVVFIFLVIKKRGIEGYRDPIYLNRSKYMYDIYPRANGTIYGFPHRYGGSWDIFSGYAYYPTAY